MLACRRGADRDQRWAGPPVRGVGRSAVDSTAAVKIPHRHLVFAAVAPRLFRGFSALTRAFAVRTGSDWTTVLAPGIASPIQFFGDFPGSVRAPQRFFNTSGGDCAPELQLAPNFYQTR